ncbi:zinc finger BED domain-containing protein 4-like [Belonocnema kinseyi]|uniref:zinc finger BED domain-containing protein 4-like n=1 Tax=Belonocnema kinseyi TaxID=2817044 RepID=UPI00143D398C|nr:zinc finger BED domain-containing protein 4-like [Belonocnema kinseyi]
MNTRSFLGVTAHFTYNGQLTSAMLGAYEFSTSHTAEHLKDKLKDVCEEWGIALSKITAIVTDNGPNIVKAVDLFLGKIFHLACCAHTLNLIAERSIKSVEGIVELLQNVRTIVTWFPTRWNSTFYMIERFILLRGDVNEIVNNYVSAPAMITSKEIEELRSIAEILRPLEAATAELCGEKYVTASTVIPLINGIQHECSKLSPTHDSAFKLRQAVLSEIEYRFGQVESVHFFAIACLLDPRFKKLHFKNPLACSRAITQIKENMRMIAHKKTENLPEESGANGESKNSVTAEEKPGFSVWNVHHGLVKKVQSQKNDSFLDSDSVTEELNMFLKSPITPFKSDPIRT